MKITNKLNIEYENVGVGGKIFLMIFYSPQVCKDRRNKGI